jgi:hypothetical protein
MFILAFACFHQLDSQNLIVLSDSGGIRNIGRNLALYEDKTARLGIEEIASETRGPEFVNSAAEIPNYNITSSKIWCRFQIVNHSSLSDWYLESSNGSISHIELYTQKKNSEFESVISGFAVPASQRAFYSNRPVFHLDLPKDSIRTFYVALYDKLPLQANLSVGDVKSFIKRNHTLDFFNGAFYGLLFMLIIYNLFIFFSVRDRVFIYYILYVASNALFISFANGYASHFPHTITHVMTVHPTWVPFLLGSTASLFMINFLNLKETSPRGYRFSIGMVIALLTVVPLDLLGYTNVGVLIVQALGIILSIYSILLAAKVYKRGYQPAKFYLIAFSFYLAGLFMYIAADVQLIPFNNFTHNALQIGTAFEAILLSLAVGDKISNFKKEKELAQEDALAKAMENERLVREQNIFLEQKVKERTLELEQQKEIVEEKNKDILDSIRYAKRIQESLMPSESFIRKILTRLNSQRRNEL